MKQNLFSTELERMAYEYVKLLLESKYGCRVDAGGNSEGAPTLKVWNPKGYEKNTITVSAEEEQADTIGILVARMINGRKVPIITDYHIIKVGGISGVYSLEEEALQKLLLDNKDTGEEMSKDGKSMYTLFPRQLLLDSCSFIPA